MAPVLLLAIPAPVVLTRSIDLDESALAAIPAAWWVGAGLIGVALGVGLTLAAQRDDPRRRGRHRRPSRADLAGRPHRRGWRRRRGRRLSRLWLVTLYGPMLMPLVALVAIRPLTGSRWLAHQGFALSLVMFVVWFVTSCGGMLVLWYRHRRRRQDTPTS